MANIERRRRRRTFHELELIFQPKDAEEEEEPSTSWN
jgi:hypothetical protein